MSRNVFQVIMIEAIMTAAVSAEEAAGPTATVDVTYASRYLFRAMPANEEPVVQPSFTLAQNGFAICLWGNFDTTDWGETSGGYGDETGHATEIDYVAKYEKSFDKLLAGAGFANYTFPHTVFPSTTEGLLYLSLAVPLNPTLTYYADLDGPWSAPASYTALDLSHTFNLWESGDKSIGLIPFAHVGYASNEWTRNWYGAHNGDMWHDWTAGLKVPVSLGKGFYLTPAYSYNSLIAEDLRDLVEDEWDRDPEAWLLTVSLGWSGTL